MHSRLAEACAMAEIILAQYLNLLWTMLFVAIVAGPIVASIDGWTPFSNRLERLATQP
jgi:hypothetical protein